MKIILLPLLMLITSVTFSQAAVDTELKTAVKQLQKNSKTFDWKQYDNSSVILLDSLGMESLQGTWKAYKGLFRFGDAFNTMSLEKPFVLEINGEKIKRSADSEPEAFSVNKNELSNQTREDRGFINKLTATLLVITWERGGNFTRYYYEKE